MITGLWNLPPSKPIVPAATGTAYTVPVDACISRLKKAYPNFKKCK